MSIKNKLVILTFIVSLLVSGGLLLMGQGNISPTQAQSIPKVDPLISVEMAAAPNGQARFLVYLAERADLSLARTLATEAQRGQWVYQRLQQTAQTSQADLITYLDQQQARGHVSAYRSFWIFNGLVVTADQETLQALADRSDVARLVLDQKIKWIEDEHTPSAPTDPQTTFNVSVPTPTPVSEPPPVPPQPAIEWNITHIRANDVWDSLGIDGTSIVVANMDTGVRHTHPALVGQYRGTRSSGYDHNYNWFDATGQYPNAPADGHGHGTHTMGTIVGQEGDINQIGVAPGAQWIAVKILDDWGRGYDSDIHAGFQWLVAPTDLNGQNPDPSRAPRVVNNSWGSSHGGNTEFQQDVQALLAAGIIPIFSAGNDGPHEGTIGSPGSYPEAWAVGATDIDDEIAYFSSRGTSPLTDAIKPEFCAPGVAIRSSWNDGDYEYLNGTSMAAPHLTGLVALLLQANPTLTLDQLQAAIMDTAWDLGDPGPDYVYGWGRIDAYESVWPVSIAGILVGQIQDEAAAPIADVTVDIFSQDGDAWQEISDAQGMYTRTLPAGTYAMHVHSYGYLPVTATHITIIMDETTRQDFTLPTAPRAQLAGRVTDAETGSPLDARVTVLDTPLLPVTADANGNYSFTVAHGNYDMQVFRRGYATASRAITISADLTADFALSPLPAILVVDDDGITTTTTFTPTLNALGADYAYWDVSQRSTEPSSADLEQYPLIIWATGAFPKDLSAAAQTTLMAYLDSGGQLFLANYLPYRYSSETTPLMRNYLHVVGIRNGKALDNNVIVGVAGNPVGAWLGPYTLSHPDTYDDIIFLTPDTLSSSAFKSDYYDYYRTTGVTYLDRLSGFRTIWLGFPFESLQFNDGVAVLNRILTWFSSDTHFGALSGQVRSAHTRAPLANATLSATGVRDQQTVTTDANGYYTLTLLANAYDLSFQRAGYLDHAVANIAVTAELTTTLDVELRPQIMFTPTALAATLTAGQSITRAFTISHAGALRLTYRLVHTSVDFTPPPTLNSEPVPVPIEKAKVVEWLEIIIPTSTLTPTLDGKFTGTEWVDANSIELTPAYDKQGSPTGKVYLKHAAGNLYMLIDHYLESGVEVCISSRTYFNLDQGEAASFTSYCDAELYYKFDYPASVVAGESTTPDNSTSHWIFEYEIPMVGLHVGQGMTFGSHFISRGSDEHTSEWFNFTNDYDYSYPSQWGRLQIESVPTPWLIITPITGTVAPDSTQAITITFDATLAQPGTHNAQLLLLDTYNRNDIVDPFFPLTLTVHASETMLPLTGVVTDRRTGAALAASLWITGGTPINSDAHTGKYTFWLEPGVWQLNVKAPGYIATAVTLTAESAQLPLNFTLERAAPYLSAPAGLAVTVPWGQTLTRNVVISNIGPQPLTFQLYESASGNFPTFSKVVGQDVFQTTVSQWATAWPYRPAHSAPLTRLIANSHTATGGALPLSPFIHDPLADEDEIDFVCGAAFISQPGWNGESPVLTLQLTFAAATNPQHVVGYIHLDSDQNAGTGYPSKALAGSPWHDIGYDYYLDLFGLPHSGYVDIWRYNGDYIGSVAGTYVGQALEIAIPLALLGNDDGIMDITLALGDIHGVTEQIPPQGHGTLGLGIDWLAESLDSGELHTAAQASFDVTFDATNLQPGIHTGYLIVSSNDPISPLLQLPLTLTVEPLATLGKLTGHVRSSINGGGVGARIAVADGNFSLSSAGTGHYDLWLTEGNWNVRASAWPLYALSSQTRSLHITAGESRTQDFVLDVAYIYLPLIMRGQ